MLCNIQDSRREAIFHKPSSQFNLREVCPFMKTDPSPVDVGMLTHPLLTGMIDDHDVSPSR